MFIEDLSNKELIEYIDGLFQKCKPLQKNDGTFNKYFELTKENLYLNNTSILVIENEHMDSYEDNGSFLSGIPLFTIFSFDDMDDINSETVRIDVKIPYKLNVSYDTRMDDMQKYTVFIIDSKSKLFVSNVTEENVDNSYLAVKELFDAKFNNLRRLNYEDIPHTIAEILSKNSIKGFQAIIYELMVMCLTRSLNDVSKEFRYEAKMKNPYNTFQMINVRDISRTTSSFSAIASENISKGILVALSQDKNDTKGNVITPQEKIALAKF